jgi:hypothetical protein
MSKGYIYLCLGIGSTIGSYLPVLFGSSFISGWSILGGIVGGIAGIWLGVKLNG